MCWGIIFPATLVMLSPFQKWNWSSETISKLSQLTKLDYGGVIICFIVHALNLCYAHCLPPLWSRITSVCLSPSAIPESRGGKYLSHSCIISRNGVDISCLMRSREVGHAQQKGPLLMWIPPSQPAFLIAVALLHCEAEKAFNRHILKWI